MVMVCVVLVCGIPGSGKSTLIEYLLRNGIKIFGDSEFADLRDVNCPALPTFSVPHELASISYDELCSIPEQFELVNVPNGFKDFRKDFLDAVEYYLCTLYNEKCKLPEVSSRSKRIYDYLTLKYFSLSGCESRLILLVEDNFYYSSMRYKWYQVSRKYGFGYCQIYLNCTVDVACGRNFAREVTVPENVISTMSAKLELPDLEKNPWENLSIVLESTKEETLPISKIAALIKAAIENPLKPLVDDSAKKREAQLVCSQNVIHQVDKILRKHTGRVITRILKERNVGEDIRIITSRISEVRQKLLREISDGTLWIPLHLTNNVQDYGAEMYDCEMSKYLCTLLKERVDEAM